MKEIILAVILIICAWTDFKYRKIYNVIIGPGLIIALIISLTFHGWPGLATYLLGLAAGIALLIIPFLLGGMGAGDVKLLGLVGAFNGPVFAFYAFIGTALAGGLMAVVFLLIKREFLQVMRCLWLSLLVFIFNRSRSVTCQVNKQISLPYGIAVALGTLGAYWVR